MLLNVCFERPLAIMRSEKNNLSSPASKSNPLAYLEGHGINPKNSYSFQRKLEVARYEMITKKNQLAKLKAEETPESHEMRDNLKKELNGLRAAYSKEISSVSSQRETATDRPMTMNALELQHQGFNIVDILVKHNNGHLDSQTQNDVTRALRWLWRSRGRHYRLLYEDEIQPRYYSESSMMASFLISYSETNPTDIDILFDLISEYLLLFIISTLTLMPLT